MTTPTAHGQNASDPPLIIQWGKVNEALKPLLDPSSPGYAAAKIATGEQMEKLKTAIQEAGRDGLISKYEQYNEWARHFSVARMTVVPFGITTAIAILSWGWDRREAIFASPGLFKGIPLFPLLALVVWLAAFILMCGLTGRTYMWGSRMLEVAKKANISSGSNKTVCQRVFEDAPLWAAIIASVGFLFAWGYQWYQFDGKAPIAEVRLVKPDKQQPIDETDQPAAPPGSATQAQKN
jgi:hypothetical protein